TVLAALFSDAETTGLVECLIREDNKRLRGASQFKTATAGGGFLISLDDEDFILNNQGLPVNTLPSALTFMAETILDGSNSEVTFFLGSFGNAIDGAKVYKRTYLVGIQQISSEIPPGFSLGQNYPNPFNPTTNLKFKIKNADFVK